MKDTFFFILVVVAIARLAMRRGEVLRFETAASQAQVVMAVVAIFGTRRKWSILTQGDETMIAAYRKSPSVLLTFLLLCLFVLPGVLYLLVGGKHESVNVMFVPGPRSALTVQVTSNGLRGRLAGRSLRRLLVTPPPPSAVTASNIRSLGRSG